ncbi:toxin-antitoxin system HicB family antitoxin [Antrihabitans stalactiti]|uniref:Toxin-antitoxin system HicB family antitoxin n=1 Tax=Antrihabitans stalactiti TaxID=2584121 RepID=A0A848K443_9NOCA|nr:toxin-antitoxin system HicB family antitoxin [Antrihabitans stalactiti]NMN93433.1 toxin-antitoxin system HicB family antitoxin [Antrihabitans stalactiti]
MELRDYVDTLQHELAVAAQAGGDEARELAERLATPLESAVRLVLLEALSAAAAEITRDLAPGSVDVRLRGREPSFVVTLPQLSPPAAPPVTEIAVRPAPEADEGAMARINLRLSEDLKGRVEEAARQAGLSVNAWLVRSAAAALEPDGHGQSAGRGVARGGEHFTGWVR